MSLEKIKNRLGFGCMRLQMNGDEVDYDEFCRMIDRFMEAGFNYFDTAHGYIDKKSEPAIRECLVKRYDREAFVLADKLSDWFFEKEEDIVPMFEKQLEICGVEYFDVYFVHCVTRKSYPKHQACHTFDVIQGLKEQGRIKHIAMSFHDSAEVLDKILSEQPCIEIVQLQINYLDYDDPTVQSKACYDVAFKHGKKVIVMEPVKGGNLVKLPPKAAKELDALGGGSYASYALRFAADHPEVMMVLSGMGNVAMVEDNLRTFSPFVPLSDKERETLGRVRDLIRESKKIPCTACNYCADVCPKAVPISTLFSVYNDLVTAEISRGEAKRRFPQDVTAADCIKCGECEAVCPQGIAIRERLEGIAKL